MFISRLAPTLCLFLLGSISYANPIESVVLPLAEDVPIPPSDDPFYQPPPGYEDAEPGTILRRRIPPFPIALFRSVPIDLAATYQVLYRSSDTFGEPTATVSTILIPHNANMSRVLSYQVVEDAAFVNCAPSYALQLNSDPGGLFGTIIVQSELLLITAALENGWVVTIPDYEGSIAAFLAHWRAGYATLDGIRATIASSPFTGVDPDAVIGLWGTSGGSVASGFAVDLHSTYAPELKIVGAALGGLVPSITTALQSLNEGFDAGIIVSGVIGLSQEYTYMKPILRSYLIPELRDKFMSAGTKCSGAISLDFRQEDIFSYFRGGKESGLFADPRVKVILDHNALPQGIPKAPVLILKSVNDEISPIADTDALVEKYCSEGATIDYKRDLLSIHTVLAVTGAPEAILWLRDRFDGVELEKGCKTSTIFMTLLQPGALQVMSKAIIDNLLDLLGKPVGPRLTTEIAHIPPL
ncbi:lipase 3 [Nannizzia gypsea CBS 118893]|uniref:Lipase 3 n=1 Tax=Arthroderma gypseum (strain ATCC MYA-4604 / CBS 118893) TaxID=535722 RepID=E4UUP9_ARTGP|nr:lipase 3 [Nannizzia gypsea CBS 118893]EFR01016.1 lipase 3 [Nannizzia gypsea CBS 118893]